MIPMALAGRQFRIWECVPVDDHGDVIQEWRQTRRTVFASVYPLGASRTQTEDGQVCRDLYRIIFPLKVGHTVKAGDRLGGVTGPEYHLEEVKTVEGRASCIGVRL